MRSPIADANAGAATDVAPTKKHAVRTATVAQQNNNSASEKAKQINQVASTLGNALGNFMQGKRETELEQRYQQAFHDQGMKEGMSEYQKDLKKTGFTEFIYGGQSPEYQGALDASARNASNAMLLEEQEFIESEDGMSMTPSQYQRRIQDKVTDYNAENFSDAPDAAFAFMKNWKDNSNELTRTQYKNNQVYLQQEARRTVAEGFQTDLDVYKSTLRSNPDKAAEVGKKLYSMDNKPKGMSDTAFRSVQIEEGLVAIQSGDYSALKLMNESGIVKSFDDKTLKRYHSAQAKIDTDNFNMSEAARLNYETVIENPDSTSREVAVARQQFDSAIIQVSARNTGTSKHLKTTFGADRWRGVLGNQYQKKLDDDIAAGIAARVEKVVVNASAFQVELMTADPDKRRTMLSERLDSLYITMGDHSIDKEVRADLRKQFISGKKQLDKWNSELETRTKKEDEIQAKKDQEEKDLIEGVQSLVTGGGFVSGDDKSQKLHTKGAVESVVNQIIPDKDMKTVDKLENIVSDPMNMYKFMRGSANFQGYVKDSPEVKTAITNLAVNLRSELTEDNTFTDTQRSNAAALEVLQQQAPELYRTSFTADERVANAHMINAINTKKGVAESVRQLDTIAQQVDVKTVSKLNGEDLAEEVGLSGAPSDVQNLVYTEYRKFLPLGHDEALKAARNYANGVNTKAGGTTVRYGSTFEPVMGKNLDDTMKVLSKTYKSGNTYKSGFTEALSRLVGGSKDADGNELYSLKQVPGVKTSIFQGGIMLEYNGRVQMIPRAKIEVELNGYDEWYKGTENIRPKQWNW